MTTGESIDNTNMENVTVTSDEAFERVTNNESFEEEGGEGYLKQNTSGLVQEIPNISFLDIADTMLESKKTFHNRKNWILRVGNAGKSVEAQPQDTITLSLTSDQTLEYPFPLSVKFDKSISSLNNTVCEIDENSPWKINILEDGYYRISYGWTIDPQNATVFSIGVGTSNGYVTADKFDGGNYGNEISGGRSIGNVYLEKGDTVYMDVLSNFDIIVKQYYTYLEIQYQQPIL